MPHVEAAKIMLSDRWSLNAGDKVGFVTTRFSGKLHSGVKPYMTVSPNEADFEYYVTNQVLPMVMRILRMFGAD